MGLLLWPWVFATGGKINGSPFHEGDLVHVLVGPYRDRVGRIYEMWPSRNQVRVEIDEQAKKDVTDVFGYNEAVCRWTSRNEFNCPPVPFLADIPPRPILLFDTAPAIPWIAGRASVVLPAAFL